MQDGDGAGGQWGDPLLAPLAGAAHVGTGAEMNVGTPEADQLRDALPRLDREQEEGVVAPSRRARPVGGGEQGVDLVSREERDQTALEPLGGNGQHARDELRVLGMAKRGVSE